ncbi:hypothetical protein L1887_51602 [Cichorium endivia]|nr:hypothetical protein L1887_51602 [Cichorium endivia]
MAGGLVGGTGSFDRARPRRAHAHHVCRQLVRTGRRSHRSRSRQQARLFQHPDQPIRPEEKNPPNRARRHRSSLHRAPWRLLCHGRCIQAQDPDDWVDKNDVPKAILAKHDDYLKAWFIAKTCDVVVIPATAFYADQGAAKVGKNYVRFSFCKDDQIQQAAPRLRNLIPFLQS